MLKSTQYLEIRKKAPSEKEGIRTASDIFFRQYHNVPLFTTLLEKPNEGINLSLTSRRALERQLRESYSTKRIVESQELRAEIAANHALLALVHWLSPSHPGFNKMETALAMFKHAVKAEEMSTSNPFCESYVIALFIELRILPFLIQAKGPLPYFEEALSRARKSAHSLLYSKTLDSTSSSDSGTKSHNGSLDLSLGLEKKTKFFKALLYDALGFSFLKSEKDFEVAEDYLEESTQSFSRLLSEEKHSRGKNNRSYELWRVKQEDSSSSYFFYNDKLQTKFHAALASVASWDLGYCRESMAELVEGEEKRELNRRARIDYTKSDRFANETTLNYYGGLSSYALASLLESESERHGSRRVVAVLRKAVRLAENALKRLSLWSIYDSDLLRGSWVTACYGKLANYTPSFKVFITRSIHNAKMIEDLAKRRARMMQIQGLGRFSSGQIGHVFYCQSQLHSQLAMASQEGREGRTTQDRLKQRSSKPIGHLRSSLEYALRSGAFYATPQFDSYAVDSRLLAAQVCNKLQAYSKSMEEHRNYIALGRKMCSEAEAIAHKHSWKERLSESKSLRREMSLGQGPFTQGDLTFPSIS